MTLILVQAHRGVKTLNGSFLDFFPAQTQLCMIASTWTGQDQVFHGLNMQFMDLFAFPTSAIP